ncbi:hypothetical protein BJX66DRAFT_111329 [Aspergillus keveii]|uniref:Uncharacterized protein n=1 Tax=Aspergillus keveii TaxID=714993 RepID=A0ABR4FKT3_9EURO
MSYSISLRNGISRATRKTATTGRHLFHQGLGIMWTEDGRTKADNEGPADLNPLAASLQDIKFDWSGPGYRARSCGLIFEKAHLRKFALCAEDGVSTSRVLGSTDRQLWQGEVPNVPKRAGAKLPERHQISEIFSSIPGW